MGGAPSGCAAWLFEGDVAFGSPYQVCVTGDELAYQELDVGRGSYGPATVARCEPGTDVEL